jgi:hypothetical protein
VLLSAHENGCSWDGMAGDQAAARGHLSYCSGRGTRGIPGMQTMYVNLQP